MTSPDGTREKEGEGKGRGKGERETGATLGRRRHLAHSLALRKLSKLTVDDGSNWCL